MATITSASLPPRQPAGTANPALLADIGAFWRLFFVRAFDPYRPELHYMRGPGPACRAKQVALSPAVQSMLARNPRREGAEVARAVHNGRRF